MATDHPPILTDAVKRIPTLDGWRGIAILLVLIDHARFALHLEPAGTTSTGQHGVAIFFVLSGFLITGRLMREKETTGSVDLRAFYSRRFFRLMPCALGYLWFCLIISLMSSARTLGIITTLSAAFFCRNFAATLLPEFPLNGHFWSLSIEEQFYLVWPLLLVFTGLRRSRWIAIAGALGFASYRFAHWSSLARLPLGKTFGTELHADALLIGCAMAMVLPVARRYLGSWMALPLVAGLLLSMARYRGLIPLHESLIIALLLAVTSSCASPVFRALDWRPLTYLGTISYSLYVWQQPFAIVAHNSLGAFCVAMFLFPIVAIGSYFLLEKPFISTTRSTLELLPQS